MKPNPIEKRIEAKGRVSQEMPELNPVKVYSVHELAQRSGLSNQAIEQATDEYQASGGRIGLPWFRRGSRKGILWLSFVRWIQAKELEVVA